MTASSTQERPQSAIGYIRVSTDEQVRDGVSLDAQRERITAYCTAKGLDLVEVQADEGISGKTLQRPALQQVLERCESGAVQHIVVLKLDRLTRPTQHLLSLVEDLFVRRGIELHSVSESLDTSTPHGRFVLTLFGGLAQMEREQTGERTKTALAFKRDHRLPFNHAPLGYAAGSKDKPMVVVDDEIAIVRRIVDAWRRGTSYRQIAADLNQESVPTKRGGRWHASTVRKVVTP